MQNSDTIDTAKLMKLYDARIQPKDMLTITVSSEEPEAAAPYNLTVATSQTALLRSVTTQPTLQTYLVDNDGYIDFPTLGHLHIGGMTKTEAETMIRERLTPNFKKAPIVNVRMVNYKISVLGEVLRPNSYTISNEKVNVFEALALAGDLTIYGKRDNITVIREKDGKREDGTVDLTSREIFNSPYYYVQQSDVIYVEPNDRRKRQGTQDLTYVSVATSMASFLANLLSIVIYLGK
jgi:polysaccharide export outer membrane protein